MRLSFPHTIVVFTSLVHGQAINTSESSPDPSATLSTSPNTFNGGKLFPLRPSALVPTTYLSHPLQRSMKPFQDPTLTFGK